MSERMATEYLLVGQGLAGTLLAHFLLAAGRDVHLIDPGYPSAASRVAAGIINPITGRRYVKSWRIEELIPFARTTYRELETQFGLSIYHEQPLIRAMFQMQEENDWLSRTGDPAYAPYMADRVDLGAYAGHLEPARAYGEVRQAAQVDIGELIEAYRIFFRESGRLTETPFQYDRLQLTENGVRYGDLTAGQIVFCEGYWAKNNPYFSYLPLKGDKGDVLLVRFPGIAFDRLLKHRVFIVPLKNEQYWIGATYINQFTDPAPLPEGREEMLRRLRATLRLPVEVDAHLAAVRPTVSDRRPLLGRHPQYPQLVIFNGLGTKGTSLGPFFAHQLTRHLVDQQPLDPEVDIRRFEGLYRSER